MNYLTQFMQLLYNYIFTLFGLNFENYSGAIPAEVISMYAYVINFFQIMCVFFFLYLVYNFLYFLFSLGAIRK